MTSVVARNLGEYQSRQTAGRRSGDALTGGWVNDSSPILTEADTCRELVTPAIRLAGWGQAPDVIGEHYQITDGRIFLIGGKARRAKQRRTDYLLHYRRDFPIAVAEAEDGLDRGR